MNEAPALDLLSPRWQTLQHAYGAADDIPQRLRVAFKGPSSGEAVYIIAALCHQGNIYDASYAAFPHLLTIQEQASQPSWELIALLAAIEIARLGDRGPAIPGDLRLAYSAAIARVPLAIIRFVKPGLDALSLRAILAALATASGNWRFADAVLNLSDQVVAQLNSGEL